MQKGGSLHSHFLIMRAEQLRESGGVSYLKEQTEVCLGPEPCEPGSLSMSQGLRACVSSLRAPRAVWAIVGTARTGTGEAQLLSRSLNTVGSHCQINSACGFVERRGVMNYQLDALY